MPEKKTKRQKSPTLEELKEAFAEFLDENWAGGEWNAGLFMETEILGIPRKRVLQRLLRCNAPLPIEISDLLGLKRKRTFATAARKVSAHVAAEDKLRQAFCVCGHHKFRHADTNMECLGEGSVECNCKKYRRDTKTPKHATNFIDEYLSPGGAHINDMTAGSPESHMDQD